MSGFFPSELWDRLIPRAMHHEPSIRHAVLALGSLHERFESEEKFVHKRTWDRAEGGFALEHYNRAIKHLLQSSENRPQAIDVCLIACMLFSSFETMRGHHGSALSHITSGVKILSEIQCNKAGDIAKYPVLNVSAFPYVRLETLEVTFNRLHSQVVQMVGCPPMTLSQHPRANDLGLGPDVPSIFSSLGEARNNLDFHWNECERVLNGLYAHEVLHIHAKPYHGVRLEDSRMNLVDTAEKWHTAFQAFLRDARESLDTRGLQAARTIEISYIFMKIYLQTTSFKMDSEQKAWDKYLPEFEHIIKLASLVVKPRQETLEKAPKYSMDMNIVAPLYAIAHRCRHPVIRRRAVALLYACPRQEGIWDSQMTALAAETLIELEEKGLGAVTCCEDIPEQNRIIDVKVNFSDEGKIKDLTYHQRRSPADGLVRSVTRPIFLHQGVLQVDPRVGGDGQSETDWKDMQRLDSR